MAQQLLLPPIQKPREPDVYDVVVQHIQKIRRTTYGKWLFRRTIDDFLRYGSCLREAGICSEHTVLMMFRYQEVHRRYFPQEGEALDIVKVVIQFYAVPLMRDWIRARIGRQ